MNKRATHKQSKPPRLDCNFFNHVGGISEEVYDVHNYGAYGASPPSFLEAEQQFWEAIGAPQKLSTPWHTPMHRQQHRVLSMRWRQHTPRLRRCATAVQGCASAVLHTLYVLMIVERVGKRPMV